MAQATAIFERQWEKEPTDLSNCSCCGEIIFSEMYKPVFICGSITACIDVVLCESCYTELNGNN